jgi:hypothetical protein
MSTAYILASRLYENGVNQQLRYSPVLGGSKDGSWVEALTIKCFSANKVDHGDLILGCPVATSFSFSRLS